MSIPLKTTWTCPKCNHNNEVTIFRSLNTDYSPDIVDQILSGELFQSKCTSCGHVGHLNYDFLYHDLVHKSMIWVLNKRSPNYDEQLKDIRGSTIIYNHTRLVDGCNELREKVSCLESGRDDGVIECYKVFLRNEIQKQQPDFKLDSVFYAYQNGKELFYLYDPDGKELHTTLDEEIYNLIKNDFGSYIEEGVKQPYEIVDYPWALRVIQSKFDEDDAKIEQKPDEEELKRNNPTSTPTIQFCRRCGKKLLPDSVFCSFCGTKVIE